MFNLNRIVTQLSEFSPMGIVLFGSYLDESFTKNSDIDIAIITGIKKRLENKKIWLSIMEYNQKPFDLKIFELLPIPFQYNIIKHHKIINGSELELSEYFYYYLKFWEDIKLRFLENSFQNVTEKLQILKKHGKLKLVL